MGRLNQEWVFLRMGAVATTDKYRGNRIPGPKAPSMRGNPFLNFHRAAEAAGYPALLIVSVVCLGLVVAAVALLALIPAGWVLALALLSIAVALVVLAGAMDASFSEGNEPPAGRTSPRAAAPDERNRVEPLPRRRAGAQEPGQYEKAA
jgi:hypothetical protein